VLQQWLTDILSSNSNILMKKNATLCTSKHDFGTYKHVFLTKCICLYLLLFLSWYQSDTNMQKRSWYVWSNFWKSPILTHVKYVFRMSENDLKPSTIIFALLYKACDLISKYFRCWMHPCRWFSKIRSHMVFPLTDPIISETLMFMRISSCFIVYVRLWMMKSCAIKNKSIQPGESLGNIHSQKGPQMHSKENITKISYNMLINEYCDI